MVVVGHIDLPQTGVGVELRTARQRSARIPRRGHVVPKFLAPEIEAAHKLAVPGKKMHPGGEGGHAVHIHMPEDVLVDYIVRRVGLVDITDRWFDV